MKKISYLLIFAFLLSCTSNTIFEAPKDLIPKDTMSLLMQDMMIAASSKYIKNKNLQKKINYMPFVYDVYKIDSARFQRSNFYYTSNIDLYKEIISKTKTLLEEKKDFYTTKKQRLDSIRRDSIKKSKVEMELIDTLVSNKIILDTIKNNSKNRTFKKLK